MTQGVFRSLLAGPLLLTAFDWAAARNPPNIILMMADDLGWGDTGYNGHPHLQTPALDRMAREGVRFDRFYSAAPVCSPTRGSCLTGRYPERYGIAWANDGFLPEREVTIAEVLRTRGYTTGHFGKWHLGTLTRDVPDSNRGGSGGAAIYAPPWEHGFDVCFSTEAKVPTWNPMEDPDHPGQPYGTAYWTGAGRRETRNLEGDDSRVIMDRVLPFVRGAVDRRQPFLAVVWFHTPHAPVVAGPEYRARYAGLSENEQHYFGCITAMDEQVGRLREELDRLGVTDDTMLWFASDNGPAGRGGGTAQEPGGRQCGSPGPFRGRKGSLYEGGLRVPGLLVWPGRLRDPRVITAAATTSDYLPTVLGAVDGPADGGRPPVDGIDLMPILEGGPSIERPAPILFRARSRSALVSGRFKLVTDDDTAVGELYDLATDSSEANDLAGEQGFAAVVQRLSDDLRALRADL